MCTLIAVVKMFKDYPVVVAANRDERLDRSSSPLALWAGAHPILAPRDNEGGGTWLGLNANRVFVGITNRFGAPRDTRLSSRGLVVVRALQADSAGALHAQMARFNYEEFNPFHLLYADTDNAFISWYDGQRSFQEPLGPGVHVVTERSLGGDDKARTELIRRNWPFEDYRSPPTATPLMELLRQHGDEIGGGTCVHVPAMNYGTRSSLIMLLAQSWQRSELFWAEGPPCTSPYVDRTSLLSNFVKAPLG